MSIGLRGTSRAILSLSVAAATLGACATDTHQELSTHGEGESPHTVKIRWHSGSWSLDVDLLLTTVPEFNGTRCVSTVKLGIDKISDFSDVYRIADIDCADLRVTERGDIVLASQVTHYDWSTVALDVNRDDELLMLGPVEVPSIVTNDNATTGVDAVPGTYLFVASVDTCEAPRDACDCVRVERHAQRLQESESDDESDPATVSIELPLPCD